MQRSSFSYMTSSCHTSRRKTKVSKFKNLTSACSVPQLLGLHLFNLFVWYAHFWKIRSKPFFFGNLSSKTILLVEKQSHQRHLFSYKCDTLLATTIPILLMYLIISGTKAPYGTSSKSPRTPESERKRITDPTTALKEDWRVFECNTWHLEPTVRCV